MYIYFSHSKESTSKCNTFNKEVDKLYNLKKYIPRDDIESPIEKEKELLYAEEYNKSLRERIELEVYDSWFRSNK